MRDSIVQAVAISMAAPFNGYLSAPPDCFFLNPSTIPTTTNANPASTFRIVNAHCDG